MNTRYYEMIVWGITYGIFAVLIIGVYSKLNKKSRLNGYCAYKKSVCISDIVILATLISVTAIRCNCGSDYYNYYVMYNGAIDWYHSLTEVITSRFQNGYMALSYIVKSVLENEFAIFGVIACIVYVPTMYIIRKRFNYQTDAFALWILLGFFSLTLNILKQSVAMVFIVLAYDCIQRKKNLGYCLFSVAACFFHISSIYVVVIILMAQLKCDIKRMHKRMLFAGIVFTVFMPKMLSVTKTILPYQYQHYVDYFIEKETSKDYKLQVGAIVVTVVFLLLLRKLINAVHKIETRNRYCVNMIKIMVFTEPFLILGVRFFIMNRVAYEAFQFLPFVFSEYLNINKKRKHFMFWTLMFVYGVAISILCGENNYYNYSTIFNDIPCSVNQFVNR